MDALQLPLFAKVEALSRLAGNQVLLDTLLIKFQQDFAPLQAQIPQWVEAEDWQQVSDKCHLLRGAAGNLGLTRIAAIAGDAVRLIRAGDRLSSEWPEQFAQAMSATLDEIQAG